MKKISLLLLSTLMAFCVFTSCSDDDDDKVNNSIVGTWIYKKANVTVEVETNNAAFTEVLKKDILNDQDDASETTFTNDGKFTIVYSDEPEDPFTGTYVYKDGVVTFTEVYGEYEDSWSNKVSISGNTMIVESDETEYYDIYDIRYLIENNESLSGIDPASIKITKAIVKTKLTRK